jgi:hypothetical protein
MAMRVCGTQRRTEPETRGRAVKGRYMVERALSGAVDGLADVWADDWPKT